jgi:ABC-type nickel/cobalt efflux system permease component RcnA
MDLVAEQLLKDGAFGAITLVALGATLMIYRELIKQRKAHDEAINAERAKRDGALKEERDAHDIAMKAQRDMHEATIDRFIGKIEAMMEKYYEVSKQFAAVADGILRRFGDGGR